MVSLRNQRRDGFICTLVMFILVALFFDVEVAENQLPKVKTDSLQLKDRGSQTIRAKHLRVMMNRWQSPHVLPQRVRSDSFIKGIHKGMKVDELERYERMQRRLAPQIRSIE